MFLVLLLFSGALGAPSDECGSFGFASYYASNMVLQRSPSRAIVWGYASQEGDNVTVSIAGETYSTVAVTGPSGGAQWSVKLAARAASDVPVSITARSGQCELAIHNVLFGDVFVCAGQSNMVHRLEHMDDPDADIEDVVNYPSVRSLHGGAAFSNTPQHDLTGILRNWAMPTPESMRSFSAVCWLFGKRLYEQYGRPVGLLHVALEGTRIQAWAPTPVIHTCFPNGTGDGIGRNEPSAMFHAQIHPLLPLAIYGAIFYQGESDQRATGEYACAIREMVREWRHRWHAATQGETQPLFPFGQVQLGPLVLREDPDAAFPKLRWAQTGSIGYLPHEEGFENHFMAVSVDLPDFDSPQGPIHPRYKRQVADRLSLAAFHVAYNDTSQGSFRGPFPTAFQVGPATLTIIFDFGEAQIELRSAEEGWTVGYEVCCSGDEEEIVCPDSDSRWRRAAIVSHDATSLTIATDCSGDERIMGIRYIWRESPCELEKCPVYSVENSLPAPPYRYDGLIEGTMQLH